MSSKRQRERKKLKKELLRQADRVDFNIWIATILLCCFGVIMVFSVTADTCGSLAKYNYDSLYTVKRQLRFIFLGLGIMFFIQFASYRVFGRILSFFVYLVGIGCIFLLKTSMGVSSGGATRWIQIYGPIKFQVAEIVKLCLIIALACYAQQNYKKRGTLKMTLTMWVIGGIPTLLLYKFSNDLSSSVVVFGITFVMSFVCTKTWKFHVGVAIAGIVLVAMYVASIAANLPSAEEIAELPFRVQRIAAWIAPERYASSNGFQVLQALYAIGRGGLFGVGLGNSIQKSILPEADNDMIFSILCEEMGALGAALAIGLLIYLMYQLFRVAISAETFYGSLLTVGVLAHIGIQSIINIAVNCSVFPNTGLPLPFFSQGGSSILFLLCELTLVLSVERERVMKQVQRGVKRREEEAVV